MKESLEQKRTRWGRALELARKLERMQADRMRENRRRAPAGILVLIAAIALMGAFCGAFYPEIMGQEWQGGMFDLGGSTSTEGGGGRTEPPDTNSW